MLYTARMGTNFILQEFLLDTSVCDDVIAFYEQSGNKTLGKVNSQIGEPAAVNKAAKDSTEVPLDGPVSLAYFAQLNVVLASYVKRYPQCDMYAPWGMVQRPNVQKYEPAGGFFSWHTERNSAQPPVNTRHLVFMTYLNDITDAGETEFQLQELKVQPRKGLTLIWPADWTHTHRGIPSPTQTKYVTTGWFNYV